MAKNEVQIHIEGYQGEDLPESVLKLIETSRESGFTLIYDPKCKVPFHPAVVYTRVGQGGGAEELGIAIEGTTLPFPDVTAIAGFVSRYNEGKPPNSANYIRSHLEFNGPNMVVETLYK